MTKLVLDSLEEIAYSLSSLLIDIIDGEDTSFLGITLRENGYLEGLNSLSRRGFVEGKLSESYAIMYNSSSSESSPQELRKRIRMFNGRWSMGLIIPYVKNL